MLGLLEDSSGFTVVISYQGYLDATPQLNVCNTLMFQLIIYKCLFCASRSYIGEDTSTVYQYIYTLL